MSKKRTPYDFQKMVSEAYLNDEDILLCAPTGSGKTEASVTPALKGFMQDDKTPKQYRYPPRMIFVAPLKTLVKSQYQTIKEAYYSKRNDKKLWEREWQPSLQTGDDPEDPLFERKIVLATVDQLLASFLNIPYGLPRKLDNINTGAIVGSYLIFDELHLYEYDQMLLTVLAMLKLLKGVCRFTLMTATLSQPLVEAIAKALDVRVISDQIQPKLFHDVESVQKQERIWHAHNTELTAEQVKAYHRDKTLCICNTVERAQDLYVAVTKLLPDVEVMLLHSRFIKKHRTEKESRLLGSDGQVPFEHTDKPMIVIATQVVEVGLDMSAKILLTECAPASSLIQRAGRCARRGGEGQVHVFRPPYVVDKKTGEITSELNFAPYHNDKDTGEGKLEICHKTWDALQSEAFNGQKMTYTDEQHLINLAHSEADRQFAESLPHKIRTRVDDILNCMATRDDSAIDKLIRKQNSVPLYIHDNPDADDTLTTRPYRATSFSLSRGQIAHFYENVGQTDAGFILMGCDGKNLEQESDDMQSETRYKWHPIKQADEVFSYYNNRWFVAHPDVIRYTPEIGLRLISEITGVTGLDDSEPDQKRPSYDYHGYTADLYHQHIAGLYGAYTDYDNRPDKLRPPLHHELMYPLTRLCQTLGKSIADGERMMRLAIALHDVGKLNRPWQDYMKAWQKYVADSPYWHIVTIHPTDKPFAHSDNRDLPSDFKAGFKHPPRGNHAVESAEACHKIVLHAANNDKLWRNVVMRAIMHHHTPTACEAGQFDLIPNGNEAIAQALRECQFTDSEIDAWLPLLQPKFRLHGRAVSQAQDDLSPNAPDDPKEVMLYYIFVRLLRLADQRSIEVWHHYLKKERS